MESSFNPDPIKQAQEIIFTRKISKEEHPHRFLKNNSVSEINSGINLGIVLDNRLSFEGHLETILNKVKGAKSYLMHYSYMVIKIFQ